MYIIYMCIYKLIERNLVIELSSQLQGFVLILHPLQPEIKEMLQQIKKKKKKKKKEKEKRKRKRKKRKRKINKKKEKEKRKRKYTWTMGD